MNHLLKNQTLTLPELKKYDNILSLTERQLVKYSHGRAFIEGYYEENIDHREQNDKVIDAAINSLDKNSIAKDVQAFLLSEDELAQESDDEEVFAAGEDMDEDTQADKEVQSPPANIDKPEPSPQETQESLFQNSKNMTTSCHLLTGQVSQEAMNSLDKNSIARGDLLNALNGVTETLKAIQDVVKEDHATTLSQDKHLADWVKSSTSLAWNLGPRLTAIENSQAAIRTKVSSLRKDTSDIKSMMIKIYQAFKMKLVPTSRVVQEDPDEPVRVPYMINGKMHYLTNDEITTHLEKEELIKKAAEQARLLAITKPEVVKVVGEEAEKIGINPERITSAKEGEKFKKARDAELKIENLRNSLDVNIHSPHQAVVVNGFRSTKQNDTFEVHTLFSFGAFAWNSVSSSYPILEQASSKSLGRKRKHMELEPEIKVPGLGYDRSLNELGVPFVNHLVISQ
ncbi:hypothetical protein Tco_1086313, partial [Tanacetum coccineum]